MESQNELKEFIEDNLITDEGYRTKYALKKIDERLLPGIELLKQKYLLREEGNFIELTHDVIVTLVKNDREDRRKKLALAREKKKAKRKMRLIVALVAIAVIAAGYIIDSYITDRAKKQRDQLQTESTSIMLKNDSLRYDSSNLKHSIDSLLAKKDAVLSKRNVDTVRIKMLSDSISNLNHAIATLYNNTVVYKDSIITLVNIIVRYKDIEKTLKVSNGNLQTERDNLETENKKLKDFKDPRSIAYNIREKGYIAKINSLEQRINVLQRNRDSLAAIVAGYKTTTAYIDDELPAPKEKKKIFGYGYDYHSSGQTKKN